MTYTIGDKIRILRNIKNYSQSGLANAAGIGQKTISYIESNKVKKQIKADVLKKIALALDISVKQLNLFEPAKLTVNPVDEFPHHGAIHNHQKLMRLQHELFRYFAGLIVLTDAG